MIAQAASNGLIVRDFFDEFWSALGAQSLATILLGFLAKTLLTHLMSKDVEAHKARLSSETEAWKSRLKVDADMLLTRYSSLNAERFEAVKQIYRGFLDLDRLALHSTTAPFSGSSKEPDSLLARLDEVELSFEYNKIFLPVPICITCRELLNSTYGYAIDSKTGASLGPRSDNVGDIIGRLQNQRQTVLTPLLKQLEEACRSLVSA